MVEKYTKLILVFQLQIGVCARYIHSTNAVFDIRDYYSARQLLEQVILNLNIEQINKLQFQD